MFQHIEGIDDTQRHVDLPSDSLTACQAEYINECVEAENPEALIVRIDELSPYCPPKGIDADPSVAEIIHPVKSDVPTIYLEAPADVEQIAQIGELLAETPGLRFENWSTMSVAERCQCLAEAEKQIAEIEHRPYCEIRFEELEEGHLGFFNPADKTITLNLRYIADNSPQGYAETLDTLIHEGRHAYQDYNMYYREVHTRGGEVNMWRWNQNEIGYQNAYLCGFEAYAMQPVETDARAFAEDVLNAYLNKLS